MRIHGLQRRQHRVVKRYRILHFDGDQLITSALSFASQAESCHPQDRLITGVLRQLEPTHAIQRGHRQPAPRQRLQYTHGSLHPHILPGDPQHGVLRHRDDDETVSWGSPLSARLPCAFDHKLGAALHAGRHIDRHEATLFHDTCPITQRTRRRDDVTLTVTHGAILKDTPELSPMLDGSATLTGLAYLGEDLERKPTAFTSDTLNSLRKFKRLSATASGLFKGQSQAVLMIATRLCACITALHERVNDTPKHLLERPDGLN